MDDDLKKMQEAAREAVERRKFERFRMQLQVRYRPLSQSDEEVLLRDGAYAPATEEQGHTKETGDLLKVMTEDISKGGLRITTPALMELGTVLLVELMIPGVPLPVNALAKVVWSSATGEGFACGLQFTQVHEADLVKLERYLLLQRKSRG